MKWATNKRLHFELGVIKCIQTLGEVRITDVIKVLTRGADTITAGTGERFETPAALAPARAEPETEPIPEPGLSPATIPAAKEWKPEPAPESKPKPTASGLAAFDSLIEAAPETSEPPPPPEPPPWKDEPKPEPVAAPPPPADDTFHDDPLIQSALEKFEGKVVSH
jgi:DNA polymerase-3 subunit gamma/tau